MAQEEPSAEPRYEVYRSDSAESFLELYKLEVALQPLAKEVDFSTAPNKVRSAANLLQGHLERVHGSMIAALNRVRGYCLERFVKAEKLRCYINKKLVPPSKQEEMRVITGRESPEREDCGWTGEAEDKSFHGARLQQEVRLHGGIQAGKCAQV